MYHVHSQHTDSRQLLGYLIQSDRIPQGLVPSIGPDHKRNEIPSQDIKLLGLAVSMTVVQVTLPKEKFYGSSKRLNNYVPRQRWLFKSWQPLWAWQQ